MSVQASYCLFVNTQPEGRNYRTHILLTPHQTHIEQFMAIPFDRSQGDGFEACVCVCESVRESKSDGHVHFI